jgi:choline transporter-like protein 2/4/5
MSDDTEGIALTDNDNENGGAPVKEGDQTSANGAFDANDVEHKCTDIIWLVLFIVWWIGMLAICGYAAVRGDPDKLIYGLDYNGSLCNGGAGTNEGGAGKNFVAYPQLDQDIVSFMSSYTSGTIDYTNFPLHGICVTKCPGQDEWLCDTAQNEIDWSGVTDTEKETCKNQMITNPLTGVSYYPYSKTDRCYTIGTKCWKMATNTNGTFFRCLPTADAGTSTYTYECEDDVLPGTDKIRACPNEAGPTANTIGNFFPDCTDNRAGGLLVSQTCKKPCDHQMSYSATVENRTTCTKVKTNTALEQVRLPASDQFTSAFSSAMTSFNQIAMDLQATMVPIILGGFVVAFTLGFVWIFVLKYCICCIVWISILLTFILLFLLDIYLLIKGGVISVEQVTALTGSAAVTSAVNAAEQQAQATAGEAFNFNVDPTHPDYYKWGGIVLSATTLVLFFVVVGLRKQIQLAIAVIKEAGNVIKDMPLTVFYPFVTLISFFGLSFYFLGIGALIASMGEISTDEFVQQLDNITVNNSTYNFQQFKTDDASTYLLIYHLFGFLWTNQVIQAIGIMAISGCAGNWYWSTPEERTNELSKFEVFRQAGRAVRYHFGSACFGGFIIAAIQLARIALQYLDEKTKDVQESNIGVKVAMKIVQCCLWCFEKCIKFLSKNAYIIVIVESSSFCEGAKRSFKLIFANALRMAAAQAVSGIVIMCGKIFICLLSTLATYQFIFARVGIADDVDISSAMMPTFLACLCSYVCASCFLYVYGITIDTILLMFCRDDEENSEDKMFASDALKSIVS